MADDALFFDTSYLAMLYLADHGYQEVRRLTERVQTIALARHAHAELLSALSRARRENRLDVEAFHAAADQLEQDIAMGLYRWVEIDSAVASRVHRVYRDAAGALVVRAADALHLACAAEGGYSAVYSHDARMLQAAPLFGLRGVDVILSR